MTFDDPVGAGFVIHAWAVDDRQLFEQVLRPYLMRLEDASAAGASDSVRLFQLHRKPPGRPSGALVDVLRESPRWADTEPSPRLDTVLLLRFADVAAAQAHLQSDATRRAIEELAASASASHVGAYRNLVRVGEVADRPDATYLFNFFYTDRPDTFLDIWKQTSMWFFRHTGLTSSFVLHDLDPDSRFPFVNHAHWDGLARLVLSILLRPSFKREVVEPFVAARMLPNAILYRARPAD